MREQVKDPLFVLVVAHGGYRLPVLLNYWGDSLPPVQFGLAMAFLRYKGEPTSMPSALSI